MAAGFEAEVAGLADAAGFGLAVAGAAADCAGLATGCAGWALADGCVLAATGCVFAHKIAEKPIIRIASDAKNLPAPKTLDLAISALFRAPLPSVT